MDGSGTETEAVQGPSPGGLRTRGTTLEDLWEVWRSPLGCQLTEQL